MKRYFFGAGPAQIFDSVKASLQKAIIKLDNHPLSILEVYHRDPWFLQIIEKTKQNIAKLLNVNDTHEILFMHGGATLQMSSVPLFFSKRAEQAGEESTGYYLLSGSFGRKALKEAKRFIRTKELKIEDLQNPSLFLNKKYDFFYYVSNETADGYYLKLPALSQEIPIVADMTSDLFSRELDITPYSIIFASAQKNLGTSGLGLVIIKKSLLQESKNLPIPLVLDYFSHSEENSLINTPNIFAIYSAYLTTKHLLDNFKTMQVIETINKEKATLLYEIIDNLAPFYSCPVPNNHRSIVNIIFHLPSEDLNKLFLKKAEEAGLLGLKGYRLVGGIRVSLYNAMPIEGVLALKKFMQGFFEYHHDKK